MTGEERFTAVDRTKLTFFQLNDIYECNSCLEIKHNLAQAGDYSVKGTHCPPPTHPPPTKLEIHKVGNGLPLKFLPQNWKFETIN